MSENTLKDAVIYWANEDDNGDDHVIEVVAAHGQYFESAMEREAVPADGVNHEFFVSADTPDGIRERVSAFVRQEGAPIKQCFANAMALWRWDDEFAYVEGVKAAGDRGRVYNHAWNVIDGHLIDVTSRADEYVGVQVPSEDLDAWYSLCERTNEWSVLKHSLACYCPSLADD